MGKKIIFSDTDTKEIIKRNNAGESRLSIARSIGVTYKVIDALLKKNGIQPVNAVKKNPYNENIFDEIDTAEKAYWLGFILADGYLHEGRHILRIKLTDGDHEHLLKFAKFIGARPEAVKIEYHNITGNPLCKIEVCNKPITRALYNLGIRQGKSTREKVSKVPEEFVRDYIRGIVDGDGSIRPDGTGVSISNSQEVLTYIRDIFMFKFKTATIKVQEHCNTWKIEFRARKCVKGILEYLYYDGCVALDRKYELAKAICRPESSSQETLDD